MARAGTLHHFQLLRTAKLEYMGYTTGSREIIRLWNLPEVDKDPFAKAMLGEVRLDGVVIVHDKFSPMECLLRVWGLLKPGGAFTVFCVFMEVREGDAAADGDMASTREEESRGDGALRGAVHSEVSGGAATDAPRNEDAPWVWFPAAGAEGEVCSALMIIFKSYGHVRRTKNSPCCLVSAFFVKKSFMNPTPLCFFPEPGLRSITF